MIVQIVGDPGFYQEVEYVFCGKHYKTFLASKAIRDHIYEVEGFSEEIILLAPSSLLRKYEKDSKYLEEKIKSKGIENFEIVEIPAIGEYKLGEEKISYKHTFDDVVASIFLELIKRKPNRVLVDISTGQNVYVFALVEAIRRYITYRQLEGVLQGFEFKANVATYQPITKDVDKVKIEIRPFLARSFFQLPEVNPDKIYKLVEDKEKIKEIGKKYSEVKSKFRAVQEKLKIAYNSIRYNVPIAFYQILDFEDDVDAIEKGMMDLVKEYLNSEISVDLTKVSNVFFSIAMFRSFKEFKKSLSEPKIGEIEKKFPEVYKKIGLALNCIFLERDLREIKDAVKDKKISDYTLLTELYIAEGREIRGSEDVKRNFFAHSGFLKEYTKIKVSNDVYLIWDDKRIEEIKRWLQTPSS